MRNSRTPKEYSITYSQVAPVYFHEHSLIRGSSILGGEIIPLDIPRDNLDDAIGEGPNLLAAEVDGHALIDIRVESRLLFHVLLSIERLPHSL